MEGGDQSELPRVNHFLPSPACVDWVCPWDLRKARRKGQMRREVSICSPLAHPFILSSLAHATTHSSSKISLRESRLQSVFFFFSKTECIGRDTNQLQLNVANAVIAKCRSDVGAQLCFVGTRWDREFKIGLYQRNDMSDEEV